MNLLADESIDRQIVDRLRQDGHLVHYVAEMDPGISDETVLRLANREATVLLTTDAWCYTCPVGRNFANAQSGDRLFHDQPTCRRIATSICRDSARDSTHPSAERVDLDTSFAE
jgi:hypothetical protein